MKVCELQESIPHFENLDYFVAHWVCMHKIWGCTQAKMTWFSCREISEWPLVANRSKALFMCRLGPVVTYLLKSCASQNVSWLLAGTSHEVKKPLLLHPLLLQMKLCGNNGRSNNVFYVVGWNHWKQYHFKTNKQKASQISSKVLMLCWDVSSLYRGMGQKCLKVAFLINCKLEFTINQRQSMGSPKQKRL